MAFYAMIVVVEEPDDQRAFETVSTRLIEEAEFVGEPWIVHPITEFEADGDQFALFGSIECVDQLPARMKS